MKKFVKILAIVMTLVILFSFAACKRKIKCEMCGETKTTHVHTIKEDGKKYKVCDECYELYKELKDAFD